MNKQKTFWNRNHPRQKESEAADEFLVPMQGVSPSLGGEAYRLASRIYLDAYNNGMCNGGEKSQYMDAVEFISDLIPVPSEIKSMVKNCRFEERHVEEVEKLVENALDFAKSEEGMKPFIKPFKHPLS
jgi:hypothetical protein